MVDDRQLCVVSLQRPGVPDPTEAHFGPGLLVGPSLVLVPAETLLAGPTRFDVLIGPAPGGSGPVELHAARPFPDGRVSIARLKGHEDRIALGHAQLLGTSGYRGRDARLDLLMRSAGKLRKLGRTGGLGQAGSLGKLSPPWGLLGAMVPDEIRGLPDDDWLAGMRDRLQPALPPLEVVVPGPDFGKWVCSISPWWDPGGGRVVFPGEPGEVVPDADGAG